MQFPWKKPNSAVDELGKYGSGKVKDVEILERLSAILNPLPHWSKSMIFCGIVGIAAVSALSGAYLVYREPNNEKTLQTAGLLLTGSLTGLIGIVAGSRL
jgi:hypothetical protein